MKIQINENLSFSRVATGLWRIVETKQTVEEIYELLKHNLENGITTIDIADIYGDFGAEAKLGEVFAAYPEFRANFEVVSKAGILYPCEKLDVKDITMGQYNHTFDYIVGQAKRSVRLMQCDNLDVLLIHRPSPLTDYAELARALNHLHEEKVVLNFGVSNFLPYHFEALQSKLDAYGIKLCTNQIEMSAKCLEHFKNGNVEYFATKNIIPMIWSPLAGGSIFKNLPEDEKLIKILNAIKTKNNFNSIDEVMYAWLNTHPLEMCVIAGSSKKKRFDSALNGMSKKLTNNEWFQIFVATQGHPMP